MSSKRAAGVGGLMGLGGYPWGPKGRSSAAAVDPGGSFEYRLIGVEGGAKGIVVVLGGGIGGVEDSRCVRSWLSRHQSSSDAASIHSFDDSHGRRGVPGESSLHTTNPVVQGKESAPTGALIIGPFFREPMRNKIAHSES